MTQVLAEGSRFINFVILSMSEAGYAEVVDQTLIRRAFTFTTTKREQVGDPEGLLAGCWELFETSLPENRTEVVFDSALSLALGPAVQTCLTAAKQHVSVHIRRRLAAFFHRRIAEATPQVLEMLNKHDKYRIVKALVASLCDREVAAALNERTLFVVLQVLLGNRADNEEVVELLVVLAACAFELRERCPAVPLNTSAAHCLKLLPLHLHLLRDAVQGVERFADS